jgi:hypothetical protein
MKTITILFLLFTMMGCASSQVPKKDFTAFYNTYEDDEGVVNFQIPIALARMIVKDEDKDTDDIVKKMDKIRFFIKEQDNGKYKRTIDNYLPESLYNDLMIVKDNGSTVIFKMKEPKQGHIREIVLTVTDSDSFVAISFTGDFTMEDAKQMTSSIKTSDFGDFDL